MYLVPQLDQLIQTVYKPREEVSSLLDFRIRPTMQNKSDTLRTLAISQANLRVYLSILYKIGLKALR